MSPPNQPEKNACFLPVFEKLGHPQAVSGDEQDSTSSIGHILSLRSVIVVTREIQPI